MVTTQVDTANATLGLFGTLPQEIRDVIYGFASENVITVYENNVRSYEGVPIIIFWSRELAREFFLEYNRRPDPVTIIRARFNTSGYNSYHFPILSLTAQTSRHVIIDLIREPSAAPRIVELSLPPLINAASKSFSTVSALLQPHRGACEVAIEIKVSLRSQDYVARNDLEVALCRELESWPLLEQYSVRYDERYGSWSKRGSDGSWPARTIGAPPLPNGSLPIAVDDVVSRSSYDYLVQAGHTGWKDFLEGLGLPLKAQRRLEKKRRRREKVAVRSRRQPRSWWELISSAWS